MFSGGACLLAFICWSLKQSQAQRLQVKRTWGRVREESQEQRKAAESNQLRKADGTGISLQDLKKINKDPESNNVPDKGQGKIKLYHVHLS